MAFAIPAPGALRRELEAQRLELERLRTSLVALQHDVRADAEKRDKIAVALLERIERVGGPDGAED